MLFSNHFVDANKMVAEKHQKMSLAATTSISFAKACCVDTMSLIGYNIYKPVDGTHRSSNQPEAKMNTEFFGDRDAMLAYVYGCASKRPALELMDEYGYELGRLTNDLVLKVGPVHVSLDGKLLTVHHVLISYLRSEYERMVNSHLDRLGIGVSAHEDLGLEATVKSDWNSSVYLCRLVSEHDGGSYNMASLLPCLESLQSADFKTIWSYLQKCQLTQQ